MKTNTLIRANKLIKYIQSGTYTQWTNGRRGGFEDIDNNYCYKFRELTEDYEHYLLTDEQFRNSPTLACGFIAWLIKHWGDDKQTIYSEYLQARLNQYNNEHRSDADVLEREFYDQYRANEEQWVKQSEAIFEFISEPERNQIIKHVQKYFDYVTQFE